MESLKLSESSRFRIEKKLLEYAQFHAVRVEGDSRSIEQVPQRTSLFNLFKTPKSMTAVIIAIALVVGGGTSYAAERTVPGDFLYTMKTEVNENVKSALAIGHEAEVKLQTRLAEERLEEAEKLAMQGSLTAEVSTEISSRLKAHYAVIEEQNTKAEAAGDFETSAIARASIEGSLRTYAGVLTSLNTRIIGNNSSALIADISTYADATANAQAQATATVETAADVQITAKAMIERTASTISEVENKLARAESSLTTGSHARAEERFKEAVSAQASAEASLRIEAYQEAYADAQTAIRIAREVETLINSLLRIQVDMNFDIDDVLDVDAEIRVETESTIETENSSSTEADEEGGSDSSIKIDIINDTHIDAEVIDVGVEGNTSLRSGISL